MSTALPSPDVDPLSTGLHWLLRLRWVEVVGQLAMLALARDLFGGKVPLAGLLPLVALVAVSNAVVHLRVRSGRPTAARFLAGLLVLDTLILTGLLAFTGGVANPFSAIYLINVTLAAVLLGTFYTWLLVGLSIACYGALFRFPVSAASALHMRMKMGSGFPLHLEGMWLAFAVTAAIIAYFVTRISGELMRKGAEVTALQRRAALDDKLASLSTLAAGAAHELATPLSTIALVAESLESVSERPMPEGELLEEAKLIHREVDRCREILRRLSADAGQTIGEQVEPIPLEHLADRLRASLSDTEASRVTIALGADPEPVWLPPSAFVQVLLTLVHNGLDAGPGPVEVTARRDGSGIRFEVSDRGSGMPRELLARVGEPFFTTKPPGKGMGLGLFLARAVAERLGGRLELTSSVGEGTRAALEMPGARLA